MAEVKLEHISKTYPNGFEAVKDFNLDIADQEFIILVGPSGCGKSTMLRMIAGLEDSTSGTLSIDGTVMNGVAPKDRDIAMVFQNYALYPHMSAWGNMAFALKQRGMAKAEIDKAVRETASILGLENVLDRKPAALSGGQRQRVAMGRAMVRSPKVFLMDEPLSHLDAQLRVQMRTEISTLHERLGATIVYVTHDQTEAMTLGTRIVVMKDGVIQQVDTPHQLYAAPDNLFVAGFIGSPPMHFLEATAAEAGAGIVLSFAGVKARLPEAKAQALREGGYVGQVVTAGVRPEDVYEAGAAPSLPWLSPEIAATVSVYELLGAGALAYGECEGGTLAASVSPHMPLQAGTILSLVVDMAKLHLFDAHTGRAIAH